MGAQVLRMQATDRLLRIVGHQQIQGLLIKKILLGLKGTDHLADEIVEMLEAEGGGNQVAKKDLR